MIRKDYHADGDSDSQGTERTPHKYFTCWYVDNLIAKCTKPPKEEKLLKTARLNEWGNRAFKKEC